MPLIRQFYSKNKPIVKVPTIIFLKCILMPNKEIINANKTIKHFDKHEDIYVIEKNETSF